MTVTELETPKTMLLDTLRQTTAQVEAGEIDALYIIARSNEDTQTTIVGGWGMREIIQALFAGAADEVCDYIEAAAEANSDE